MVLIFLYVYLLAKKLKVVHSHLMEPYHRAMERHLPYAIRQCYLPLDR